MANSDNIIEILLRFGLDKTQAQEAVKQIQGIKAETEDAGKAGVKAVDEQGAKDTWLAGKKHELRASLHALGREFPIVGQMARFLFNPITLGIGLVSVGLRAMIERFREWSAEMDAAGARGAQSLGGVREAIEAVKLEALKADKAFAASQSALERKSTAAQGAIELQVQTLNQLADAAEAFELSQTKDERARTQIQLRYDSVRRSNDEKANAQRIAARESELNAKIAAAQKKEADLQRLAGGRSEDRISAELKSLPELRQKLDEAMTAQKAAIDNQEKKIAGFVSRRDYGRRLGFNVGEDDTVLAGQYAKLEELTRPLRQMEAIKSGYDRMETNLTAAQSAIAGRDKLEGQIADLTESVRVLKAEAGIKSGVGRVQDLYKREGAVYSEADSLGRQISRSAGMGDLSSVALASARLATLPATIARLAETINSVTAQVESMVNQHANSTDRRFKYLEGNVKTIQDRGGM